MDKGYDYVRRELEVASALAVSKYANHYTTEPLSYMFNSYTNIMKLLRHIYILSYITEREREKKKMLIFHL